VPLLRRYCGQVFLPRRRSKRRCPTSSKFSRPAWPTTASSATAQCWARVTKLVVQWAAYPSRSAAAPARCQIAAHFKSFARPMPTALTRAAMRWCRWQDRVQPSALKPRRRPRQAQTQATGKGHPESASASQSVDCARRCGSSVFTVARGPAAPQPKRARRTPVASAVSIMRSRHERPAKLAVIDVTSTTAT
jgi:hypothetical protein